MKQHWVVAATLIDKACEMLRIQPGRKLIGVKKLIGIKLLVIAIYSIFSESPW